MALLLLLLVIIIISIIVIIIIIIRIDNSSGFMGIEISVNNNPAQKKMWRHATTTTTTTIVALTRAKKFSCSSSILASFQKKISLPFHCCTFPRFYSTVPSECSSSSTRDTGTTTSKQQEENNETKFNDTASSNGSKQWIQFLKNKCKAYSELMRLDKPIGTYLLLFPCLWSLAFADQFSLVPDPRLTLAFTVGALIMRGAGCTVNDLWDRKFDAMVERTKNRPIASGRVSVPEALAFLTLQLSAGAWILFSQFNADTIIACTASLLLVVLYPLMKRITHWPQAFLGLTFNWGALVGYMAISGFEYYNTSVTIPLYAAGICWTLVYDTLYAHQDKVDDRKVGVKSTALYFGDGFRGKTIMAIFAFLFGVIMLIVGYYGAHYDPRMQSSYYLAVLLSTAHLFYQIYSVNLDNPAHCGQMFRSNRFVGIAILLGIIASNLMKQMDAIEFQKERAELIKSGHDPNLLPQDEELNRARAMYMQLQKDRELTIVERLKLVLHKLGL
jgi:4-hydroxybenzoate polyprenyltransferase